MSIRLLTFNIRAGGTSRIDAICSTVCGHKPDVAVITEHRANPAARKLAEVLASHGLVHQASSGPLGSENGIFVASRLPFSPEPVPANPPSSRHWLGLDFGGFGLGAIYMPMDERFGPMWEWILHRARVKRDTPYLFIGDLNTLRQRESGVQDQSYVDRLVEAGYVDAWRQLSLRRQTHTWQNHNGTRTRIDYALLSPPLAQQLVRAYHSHEEIEKRISDHAALIIELDGANRFTAPLKRVINQLSR